jgi:hypothetical protein
VILKSLVQEDLTVTQVMMTLKLSGEEKKLKWEEIWREKQWKIENNFHECEIPMIISWIQNETGKKVLKEMKGNVLDF